MKEIEQNQELVAYCGLYCGACGKYKKEKCPGCIKTDKMSWCKVRTCCIDQNIKSCADCTKVEQFEDCKLLNNFISKFFSLIFKTDRVKSIEYIKKNGYDAFIEEMVKQGSMAFKRS